MLYLTYIYHPPKKLREGNVFSCVRLSTGGPMWPIAMMPWTSPHRDPLPQTCSNLFNLDLTVTPGPTPPVQGPPWPSPDMKHIWSARGRLASYYCNLDRILYLVEFPVGVKIKVYNVFYTLIPSFIPDISLAKCFHVKIAHWITL